MKLSIPKSLILGASLLLLSLGLVVYGETQVPAPNFHGDLHALLPEAPKGWTRVEKPIANTMEMQEAINELLNYDDGVFVDYLDQTTNNRISVYIAYWTPGKMSQRLIASHTPDVCWVQNGWKMKEAGEVTFGLSSLNSISGTQTSGLFPHLPEAHPAYSPTPLTLRGDSLRDSPSSRSRAPSALSPLVSSGSVNSPVSGEPHSLPLAQARTFTTPQSTEYVYFWHLADGTPIAYDTRAKPPWYSVFTDLWTKGLNQRQEQFFIRLSSNHPFFEIPEQPLMASILLSLPFAVISR